MRTEAEIRMKGMEALLSELGDVDAEVFIKMILREPFDYTKWQKHLWQDLTVDELARRAAELEKGSDND